MQPGDADEASIRARAEFLAHKGVRSRKLPLLVSRMIPPRNDETLELLRMKYPLESAPIVGAQSLAYIDDIVIMVRPAHARSAAAMEAIAAWLKEHMQPLGVELKRQKWYIIFRS